MVTHREKVLRCVVLVVEFSFVLFFCWAFNWIFHNPYCNVLFTCGCTFNWLGGWDGCNVHSTDPSVPKCPWCVVPNWVAQLTQWLVILCMVLSYFIIAYGHLLSAKRRKSWMSSSAIYPHLQPLNILCRPLAIGATFLVVSTTIGLYFYVTSDYPHFLFA